MKLRIEQLKTHLNGTLAPFYLITGDEPLQRLESADLIRAKARLEGFVERELIEAETQPDWPGLTLLSRERGLFSPKRLLEIRLGQKPDRQGQAFLVEMADKPPEETLLLLTLPKLTQKDQQTLWFKGVERQAVHLAVWPIEGSALLRWLDQRLASRGLLADQSGLRLIAARVEGNLLAASQEVEKLRLLHGPGQLTDAMIRDSVAQHARYSVYDLAEEWLAGHPGRLHQILRSLRQEGLAPPIVLWALTREIRLLYRLKSLTSRGEAFETLARQYRLWDRHKQNMAEAIKRLSIEEIREALRRAAEIDQMTKGLLPGDPWLALSVLCTALIGLDGGQNARHIPRHV